MRFRASLGVLVLRRTKPLISALDFVRRHDNAQDTARDPFFFMTFLLVVSAKEG